MEPQDDKENRLLENSRYIGSKYERFYLRTIQTEAAPLFKVMGKIRNSPLDKDHELIETRNRHVAYFTLEALKVVQAVTEYVISLGRK